MVLFTFKIINFQFLNVKNFLKKNAGFGIFYAILKILNDCYENELVKFVENKMGFQKYKKELFANGIFLTKHSLENILTNCHYQKTPK